MKIQIRKRGGFKLVYFELPIHGVDPVAVAAKIKHMAESWNGPETVLFRGQGPVWLYGMLVHSAHATPNTATFEPRKDGYVVVHQHGGAYSAGEVIPSSVVGMTIENGKIIGGEDVIPKRHIVVSVGGPTSLR
jgi:CRISPR-associated Csx3 family protein